jgi:hypothetical protein
MQHIQQNAGPLEVASKESSSLDEILIRMSKLADADNLGSVVIPFNATYFIEERRDSGIPGINPNCRTR